MSIVPPSARFALAAIALATAASYDLFVNWR